MFICEKQNHSKEEYLSTCNFKNLPELKNAFP